MLSVSRLQRWSEMWKDHHTPWQNQEVHPILPAVGHLIGLPAPATAESSSSTTKNETTTTFLSSPNQRRVLVPLCGKTVDLAFLAHHENVSQVVGVDGIGQAFDEFQHEHPKLHVQAPTTTNSDQNDDLFRKWKGNKLELWEGDFFHLLDQDMEHNKDHGVFDLIVDRGSLVAIDPSLRDQYLEIVGRSLRPHTGQWLLVVVERNNAIPHNRTQGPPHHFDHADLERLLAKHEWVGSIQALNDPQLQLNIPADPGNNDRFVSTYYLIQAK